MPVLDPMQLADLRKKAAEDTLTVEEMANVITTLREGREFAAASSASKKVKAPAAPIDTDALLNQLF